MIFFSITRNLNTFHLKLLNISVELNLKIGTLVLRLINIDSNLQNDTIVTNRLQFIKLRDNLK